MFSSNRVLPAVIAFLAGGLLLAIGVVELRAAEPGTQPATKPAPMVIVLKSDGSRIRGQIVSSDRAGLTIAPAVKPKDPPATPVTLTWTEIRNVSNGLTQAKALAQWKIDHHADLCPKCDGDGMVWCETCKGTGHDPASGKTCRTCKGELLVSCKTPHCKDGKKPCPMPCMKLTEGEWGDIGGNHARLFHAGKETIWVSTAHLGQLISFDPKTKQVKNDGKCPVCDGTTIVKDDACHGTGKIPCPTCTNRPNAAACPANCDHGKLKCADCDGTGLTKKAA